MLVHVLVGQRCDMLIQYKLELDPVLHVVVGEHEPEGTLRSGRADQVFLETDPDEIADPHRGDREERKRHSQLGAQGCLDGRVLLQQAGLRHELLGEADDLAPDRS